jgi:REP element-mobilizing transposase RayT
MIPPLSITPGRRPGVSRPVTMAHRAFGLYVLADHVHVIASFRPEGGLVSFIRHAKSESARQINLVRGAIFEWARGYFVESLSRTHVRAACAYVARQYLKHPDRVPP